MHGHSGKIEGRPTRVTRRVDSTEDLTGASASESKGAHTSHNGKKRMQSLPCLGSFWLPSLPS